MSNDLIKLTFDDNIDEIVADFLIDRDVECFIRECRPLTRQAYKQLKHIANLCRETELYKEAVRQDSMPDKWFKMNSRKFLEDILYRISVEDVNSVSVILRIGFPFFYDKYNKEYKGKCYEDVSSACV